MMVAFLISALWQGALVIGLTKLVLCVVPVRNATTRYAAWFITLLSLAFVPMFATLVHWQLPILNEFARQGPFGNHSAFSLVALGPIEEPAWNIALPIGLVWIAGSALALSRLIVSYVRIARVRRRAVEVSRVDGVAVLASSDLSIPIAAGVLTPAILIPRELFESLSPADLKCTIQHELAHIRRGDIATNVFERLLEAAFFWNPWVHVAGRRLAAEREAACDDWAVVRLGEPNAYAHCLAQLGRRLPNPATPLLTPSALGSRHSLVTRIERLMTDRSPGEVKINYAALGGMTMIFAAMSVVLQTLAPAPVNATVLAPNSRTVVADTACKNPNAEPQALNPAAPDLPKSKWPSHKTSAIVIVRVGVNGKAEKVGIDRSSGNADVDRAVLKAAQESTYTPRLVNCVPEVGTYLFKADFDSGP